MNPVIQVEKFHCLIGKKSKQALPLVHRGATKRNVLRDFSVTVACYDLNFFVQEGEVFVIMGPSGCGKSSLLRALDGLLINENCVIDGEIRVWNENSYFSPLKPNEKDELQKKTFSFVFQNHCLLEWRTILDNVALPLEIRKIPAKERYERAYKILETVKLKDWAHHYPKDLSGGMKQRVGLARALVTESPILLMDEPFSALDPHIRRQLQDELLRLKNDLNKTIVFVTHDEAEAKKLGSRIAFMNDGHIDFVAKPADFFERVAQSIIVKDGLVRELS